MEQSYWKNRFGDTGTAALVALSTLAQFLCQSAQRNPASLRIHLLVHGPPNSDTLKFQVIRAWFMVSSAEKMPAKFRFRSGFCSPGLKPSM